MANGLRTDHPIPDLPFVDDSHIPVSDPAAVEAGGRNRGEGMWGRSDPGPDRVGWLAFTTDSFRHDLAWCIRWHPEHHRSVILCRNEDAPTMHMAWWGAPLLFRAGGYWWDGETWYRPLQVWDTASQQFVHRPVPSATVITAGDLLDRRGDARRGHLYCVNEIDVDDPPKAHWIDELALWASDRDGDRPLSTSVITIAAPELTGDQLLGVAQMAEMAGIASATLRSYISRGEGDVPEPQATVSGRSLWSRPVAEDWAEQRRHSSEAVTSAISTARNDAQNPSGVTDLWDVFAQVFYAQMWKQEQRKRWTLRWRTPTAIRELAESLGWYVAGNLDRIIPIHALASTVRHAVLDELATGQELHRSVGEVPRIDNAAHYGIARDIAITLDWLIRHDPSMAQHVIGDIVGEAESRFKIPRNVTGQSLSTALHLDSKLDGATINDYLDRALPPEDEE